MIEIKKLGILILCLLISLSFLDCAEPFSPKPSGKILKYKILDDNWHAAVKVDFKANRYPITLILASDHIIDWKVFNESTESTAILHFAPVFSQNVKPGTYRIILCYGEMVAKGPLQYEMSKGSSVLDTKILNLEGSKLKILQVVPITGKFLGKCAVTGFNVLVENIGDCPVYITLTTGAATVRVDIDGNKENFEYTTNCKHPILPGDKEWLVIDLVWKTFEPNTYHSILFDFTGNGWSVGKSSITMMISC